MLPPPFGQEMTVTYTGPAVQVTDVSKAFGATVALRDVSLSIRQSSIHGLVGRNGAGKSTLVSILTGINEPDSGSVEFSPTITARRAVTGRSPCATVYQRSQLFPYLTVAENLFLQAGGPHLVNWSERDRRATSLLREWGLGMEADRPVHELRSDERQLVEIARAFAAESQIIVLDEPTAALRGAREREVLFRHIRRWRDESGAAFLYISHYLQEVFQLCDEVTVLRDGAVISTRPVAGLTEEVVIRAMVGSVHGAEEIGRHEESTSLEEGRPVLLTAAGMFPSDGETIDPETTIQLREGEALGFVGAAGSGAIECAESIAGFRTSKNASVEIGGRRLPNGRTDLAIGSGIVMVAADRHLAGIFPNLSVGKNISISALESISRAGVMSHRAERAMALKLLDRLSIVASSSEQGITSLSGGNQQKAMFARAMAVEPSVLILCNPTVGVDVASKAAIYGIVRQLLDAGMSLIIASEDELKDVAICDRVIVFKDGIPIRELGRDRTEEQVLAAVEGLGE
jgi:simple sugar transport system ATP-binding protein